MSSNPLLREPAGGSAFTTMIAPIFSLSSWLPRRRDERPPFSSPASGPLAASIYPCRKARSAVAAANVQPRKLILHSLMSTRSFANAPPSFSVSACIRVTSPIRSRTTPIRSACVKRSNELGDGKVVHSLNRRFQTCDSPSARKFAPVTNQTRNSGYFCDLGQLAPHPKGCRQSRVGSSE